MKRWWQQEGHTVGQLPPEYESVRRRDVRRIFMAFLLLALGTALAVWQNTRLNDDIEALVEREAVQARDAIQAGQRRDLQDRYDVYLLCRSVGFSRDQCREIAKGSILEAALTVDELEAKFAQIAEIRAQRIFVKGKTGIKGRPGDPGQPGRTGPQGPPGATGPRGDTGPQGPAAQRGLRGARGARGPRGERGKPGEPGAQGAPGPPGTIGPPGPAGVCKARTIVFPSVGPVTVCVP